MTNSNGSIGENKINQKQISLKTGKEAAAANIKRTTIGGQALIEGLMMVGPRRVAMAVRKADGSIVVEEIAQGRKMIFFEKVPFIRGGIRLARQMITGTGALMKSAELSEETDPQSAASKESTSVPDAAEILPGGVMDPDAVSESESIPVSSDDNHEVTPQNDMSEHDSTEEAKKSDSTEEVKENAATDEALAVATAPAACEENLTEIASQARSAALPPKTTEKVSRLEAYLEKNMNIMVILSAVLGIVFGIILFILLPRLIVDLIWHWIPASQTDSVGTNLVLNLFEGILRIAILIGYLAVTSRVKDIARVWMYHGAEHKTIACYEAGEPLTVENIRKFGRFHPRCGTAFLFIVVIVSILVFSVAGIFIGVNIWWINALIRLALVPLIAGIAFEFIRFTGKHDDLAVCRALSKPGMWMQRFTTREPDDSMIEVAIAAMQAVLPEDTSEDNW